MTEKAVTLMSGGPDSFAATAWACRSGYDTTGLFFDAEHEVAQRERRAVVRQTDWLGIEFDTLDVGDLKRSLGTAAPEAEHFFKGHGLELFPFSPGIVASITASYAASRGISTVVLGLHADDFSKSTEYRPAVLETVIGAAGGDDREITVELPFADNTKRELVERAERWKTPIRMSWSCTQSTERHCGECVQCTERADALGDVRNPVGEPGESKPTALR